MIRVTLVDSQQTIAFSTGVDVARRLVAACAANPDTAGELLLAAEIFRQGIAAAVMVALMDFDKALLQHGSQHARRALTAGNAGDHLVWSAFQVVDDETKALAFTPIDDSLLILDLPARTITISGEFQVPSSGELLAHNGQEVTGRAITYILPREWSIVAASQSAP